jgi:hypothetical protein
MRTEYERLCDELDGPADIGLTDAGTTLGVYCREYPSYRIQPVLLQFHRDERWALKHWPWAAFAISQYLYETEERKKYTNEPTPQEIMELLSQVERSTHDLASALCQLQSLASRLTDPTSPYRRAHLAWLDALITQAVAGWLSTDVEEHSGSALKNYSAKMTFLKRLAGIEVVAKQARKRVDRKLLERERGQSNPALPNFVRRGGMIWRSLTGRKPSANKVAGRDPDFVLFMQELARIGAGRAPSREQVATSLRTLHPRD